jgi:transcriptional regulator with GAF, ATPase, and Fis domain
MLAAVVDPVHQAAQVWLADPWSLSASLRWKTSRQLLDLDAVRHALHLAPPSEARPMALAALVVGAMAGQEVRQTLGRLQRRELTGDAALVAVAEAAGRCGCRLLQMAGWSAAMAALRSNVWRACFGDDLTETFDLVETIRNHHVLVHGETGTGKELVAKALQEGTVLRGKKAKNLSFNVAALTPNLVESELFGYRQGAFSGAEEDRAGLLEEAHGGTIFLDEIGELSLPFQAKLLRAVQEREIRRVGDTQSRLADVRYVSATHRELEGLVEAGSFRADLLHRLQGFVVRVPPLRERPEDIPELGATLLPVGRATPARARAEQWLRSREVATYGWPGNVRELQAALRNVLLNLPDPRGPLTTPSGVSDVLPLELLAATWPERCVREWYEQRVYARCGGNLAETARVLGVATSTLHRRALARE